MVVIRSHDALVRFVFGDPEQMAELLRAHLPPAVVAAMDWSTLRRLDGSFVDEALRESQSDLLFEVRMGEVAALLYVLHEHKSWADPFTSLQVARYSVRILDRWVAENPGQKSLPAILPFVLHHGDRPWQVARCLGDLIDLGGGDDQVARFLSPLQLQLRFHLLDLAALDEEQIDAMRLSAVGALTLRFLQFLRLRSPEQAASDILRWRHLVVRVLDHPQGKEVISALFSWWLAGAPASSETLRIVMTKIHEENAPMRSLLDMVLDLKEERGVQRGKEQGMQEGMQQGMQQGLLAGLRALLTRQMCSRFGELPPAASQRLAAADAELLQQWGERLLSAARLDDVFAAG